MSSLTVDTVIAPTPQDQELATLGRRALVAASQQTEGAQVTVAVSAPNVAAQEIALPPAVVRVLARVLDEVAQGHVVTVMSLNDELTTQEAADLLQVSQPYLVTLLDQGVLAFRKVGNQRRVRVRDVIVYQQQQYEGATQEMREVTRLSDEMGLYD